MSNIKDITSFAPKGTDEFLFDTNIWFFLHGPIGNYSKPKQTTYSAFYQQIIIRKLPIWITTLVLSEFCNRWLRIEFEVWKQPQANSKLDFKRDFVGTESYKETVKDIIAAVNTILKSTSRNTDDFNAVDLNNILTNFSAIDFNDSYLIELSRKKGWKIVTDDKDFSRAATHGVEIVTANI